MKYTAEYFDYILERRNTRSSKWDGCNQRFGIEPEVEMLPVQAVNALEETKSVNEAEGFVSAEYGMVYPPGIPFLVPGEKITKTVLDKIENAKKAGLHLFGFADVSGQTVQVVKEEKKR